MFSIAIKMRRNYAQLRRKMTNARNCDAVVKKEVTWDKSSRIIQYLFFIA
jgi:hypothetical protein